MSDRPPIVRPLLCLACLAACLARHAGADIAVPERQADPPGATEEPEGWLGVDVARRGTVVAIWSSRRLLVSSDGGHRFRERLAGVHDLDGVAVSAEGTVFALRGRRLGTASGDDEHWKTLPFQGFPSVLAAGAGRLVWIGHQRARPTDSENQSQPLVAISPDEGATWAFQRPSDYHELYLKRAFVADDGRITIDATFGDCRSWDAMLRGRVDGTKWREDDPESTPGLPPIRDGRGREYRIAENGAVERRESARGPWSQVQRP